jgi:hypothetical protein
MLSSSGAALLSWRRILAIENIKREKFELAILEYHNIDYKEQF